MRQQRDPINFGHDQIGDDNIVEDFRSFNQGFPAACGAIHDKSSACQPIAHCLQIYGGSIHHQDAIRA